MHETRPTRHLISVVLTTLVLVACGGATNEAASESGNSSGSPGNQGVEAGHPDQTEASDPSASDRWGEPLDHPERYYGLYANPATPNRAWFVTEAKKPAEAEQAPEIPPGHLMIGAMWGDVAPWPMRTLSETEFEQAWVSEYQPEPVAIRFELGEDGSAVTMEFTDDQMASQGRLVRQGDLPADWQ